MAHTSLNKKLSELIVSQSSGNLFKKDLSQTSLKYYINLSREETLKKINIMSCTDFANVVQELGPFYESENDKAIWDALAGAADFAAFETAWLKLPFPQRARLRPIARVHFLIQEFFLQAMRVKTLAPDLVATMLDPKGLDIDQLIELVHARYRPLTVNDLPRLLAKCPEQLTYHEICSICLLDSPQTWSKIFHTLDYPKAEVVRERMQKGSEAIKSAYMMSREIRLMHRALRVVEAG